MANEKSNWAELDINNELSALLDEVHDKTRLRTHEEHAGFDGNVGDTWIYPNNYPIRAYQYNITQAALFRNTLVVLPTGLGKTFIAAVIMYNIYRWYPRGKVIFMAPTRPLVAQQIEACQRFMPFPVQDTVELTGKLQRDKRIAFWHSKRVFFATPQVVQADMVTTQGNTKEFPFEQVKLIVIDEAHKAKGRYAYTEVAQKLWQRNRYFRVLALSATPGRSMEDVCEVVRNLFISHLEVRFDTSIDVMQYLHQRKMKTIVVPLGDDIKRVRDELANIIDPYVRQLVDAGVLNGSQHITRNSLIFEQKRFRERSMHQQHPQQSTVGSNFSICISLFHSLELLERHGLRVFLNSFDEDEEGRQKFVLALNPQLKDLVMRLRGELGPNPFDVSAQIMTNGRIAEMPRDLDFGHPKFEQARECVLAHFGKNPDSRAIVFCEYRESVVLIHRLLLQHAPLLKPRCFVGQGGTTGSLRALSQKQQIQIMTDFRAGKSNILIATSIGEEGIDVGEVDLIVCFDISTANPTRFIQRIGRTGRQKLGHVIMLVTEGKEQQLLQDVLAHKDQTNKKLMSSTLIKAAFYKHAPRMIPAEFDPQCMKVFIKPSEPESTSPKVIEKKTAKKTATKLGGKAKEKPISNTQDLRKFFGKTVNDNVDTVPAPTQETMQKVHQLYQDLNMPNFSKSNTQFIETQQLTMNISMEETPAVPQSRLSVNHIRKFNKFLRSSGDFLPQSQQKYEFLAHLKAPHCSRAGKLLAVKLRHKYVRELCEQMDILCALDQDNDMSIEEQAIRDTYEALIALFSEREALQRFLEDAEYEQQTTIDRLQRGSYPANSFEADDLDINDDLDMTAAEFDGAMKKIFHGLDEQGPGWDSFDYRQQELKRTEVYQDLINSSAKSCVPESMIFGPAKDFTFSDEFEVAEDLDVIDSKYCRQLDKDFGNKAVKSKSTPLQGALVKAFEKQQTNANNARKRLEQLDDNNGDDDDIIFVSFTSADGVKELNRSNCSPKNSIDMLALPHTEHMEQSFMLRQQSTPVQQYKTDKRCVPSPPIHLEDELEFDLDAFMEPLPEELDLLKGPKHSSLKENIKVPLNLPNTATKTTKPVPPDKASNLFELLESKPTNTILTATTKPPLISLPSPHSPKGRLSTSAAIKQYETSPNLLEPYFKQLRRLEGMRQQRKQSKQQTENAVVTAKPDDSTNKPSDVVSSKPKLIESETESEASPAPATITRRFNPAGSPKRRIIESETESEASPATLTRRINTAGSPKRRVIESETESEASPAPVTITRRFNPAGSPKRRIIESDTESEASPAPVTITRRFNPAGSPKRKIIKSETESEASPASAIRRKPSQLNNLKRKYLQSMTESAASSAPLLSPARALCASERNSDSDFELTPKSQPKRRCLEKLQSKPLPRTRLCEFFADEAEVSGDESGDEHESAEHTLGNFVCDSVIVGDNVADGPDDAPTCTQMHAFYLQSVKNPQPLRGGFKMPIAPRVSCNDPTEIYSQAVPEEPSQYVENSFVVNDMEHSVQPANDKTLSPLTRAELILKQRRRREHKKRKLAAELAKSRRRKCYQLEEDGNSTDDFEGS